MKIIIPFITLMALTSCGTAQKVIVTAHRGASGSAPENTKSSVAKGLELGADFCEIDVQETSDGKIILLHDGNLKRTAGLDANIWETPFDSLKRADVGSWFSSDFKGEPVPTLVEIIELVKGKGKLNIELKTNKHEQQLAERTLKILEENNFTDQCIVTSFKLDEIVKVRELNKNVKVGLIFSKLPDNIDVFTADFDLLSVNKKLIDKEFIEKAHNNNKQVHVWTVNDEDEMKRLIELGVDSIITNYPEKLIAVIKSL